ncbi:MAG: GTPase ObgE, partial [Bacteroidales bacterium]|nr:GTPase ObgE [Bacteroidales bacterium]
DIARAYGTLLDELRQYNPELLVKQRVLAVTKCDIIDADIERELEKSLPEGLPHVFISSASGTGLDKLKDCLWKALQA